MTDAELRTEQRAVILRGFAGALFSLAILAAGYLLLPRMFDFPTEQADALAFALQAELFVALWVVIAIRMVSRIRFRSAADNRGSAFSKPSAVLRIPAAFLQNTLEQGFIAVVAHLALATLITGPALALIPAAVLLFAIGRISFLMGYEKGAAGRAFGIVVTMLPSVLACLWAAAMIATRLIALVGGI